MISRRPSTRGNIALLTVISFSVLIITFILLTMSQGGVIYTQKSWARYYSLRLADSAIYATISQLKEGKIALNEDVRFEVDPAKYGTLTFDSKAGVPYSTNNLVGNTKKTGWNGTAVPPGFIHLVAVGHHHGMEVVREAVVKDPPYPYSLASAGRIEGEQMEVFGLPEGLYSELKPGEQLDYTEDDKEPSHVVSNSTAGGADKAVTLGTGTKIAGNVKAAGEIDPGDAVIQGLVLPGSTEQNLPGVNIDSFDPAGKKAVYNWDGSVYDSVVGRARHAGNLTVGDLRLADGLLFVDGDVTITGTVKGKGAIVATGKITVTGTMDTQADHAALVAKDDITIHGDGPNSSKFQGLVYSEGSIDIARTTIMGAAVSKDSTGVTKLEEVKAVAIPELTAMDFDLHITLEEAKKSYFETFSGGIEGEIGVWQTGGTFVALSNANTENLKGLAASFAELDDLPGNDGNGSSWKIAIKKPDGSFEFEGSGFGNFDFEDGKKNWGKYVLEHDNSDIQIVEIFEIDLNTLISLDVELEMMYHTTVPMK